MNLTLTSSMNSTFTSRSGTSRAPDLWLEPQEDEYCPQNGSTVQNEHQRLCMLSNMVLSEFFDAHDT
jgi:hypothetical protein